MLAGDEIHVALAFGIAVALIARLLALGPARPAVGGGGGIASALVGYRRRVPIATTDGARGRSAPVRADSVSASGRPNARSVAVRLGDDHALSDTGGGVWAGEVAGESRRRLPLRPRRRRRLAGPVLALAARGRARAFAHPGHERVRDRRRAGARPRRARPLRAPRRHLLARGDVRRRRPATRRTPRARRHRDRADARRDLPGRTAAGATTGSTPSPRTRPTAARQGWRASSTPPTAKASASCSTSSTTTSVPGTRRCARSGRTSPTASARRRGARRSTTRRPACASGRSRTPSSGCASTGSTGCASTPSTRSPTTRTGTSSPSSPTGCAPRARTRS